jgi:hypothetical protein
VTRERWIRIAVAAALVALAGYAAWVRWHLLAASPFPLGVDGYYYPVQLRALLETGHLQYPASPLTFWFMAPFAAATDPITGAKLGAAIGGALAVLPAYGVASRLAVSRGAGLLAAAIVATSASSQYLATEFVKQGIGLTLALSTIWLVLRALDTPSRRRTGFAIAGLVVTALAHKLAAAVVLAIAVPAVFQELRARGVLRGRRLLYLLVAAAIGTVVIGIAGLVAPQRFLSPHDLALVGDLMTTEAHWDAPALERPGLALTFDHEALAAAVIGLAAAVVLVLRRRDRETLALGARTVAWMFVALAIIGGLPWLDVGDTQGLAYRLRVAAFVPLAICAAIVAGALARLAVKGSTPVLRMQRDALLAAIALVLVVRAPTERAEGRIVAHPALVSAVMAARTKIPAGTTVIVPERHILFMTAWYTRAPVALRPDHIPYGRRVRLLPLHFIEMGSPLEQAIDAARSDPRVLDPPIGLHPRHRNGLVLVTEATWDWLLANVPPGAADYWARWQTI